MAEIHAPTAVFPAQFTQLQRFVLLRLRDDFGVDIEPAYLLSGTSLEAWIEGAEDRVFNDLFRGA